MESFEIRPCGDSGVFVIFGKFIDPIINKKVHYFRELIENKNILGITETIPSYTSLLICYDPLQLSYAEICTRINNIMSVIKFESKVTKEVIHVPVLYGGSYGKDITRVAKHNKLTVEEVIKIHNDPEYLIYMIGFKPGFLYLGGLSDRLVTPRLETPRLTVEKGSVGIAGNQTGIYPQNSPGGWQIIGHTPLPLIDWSLAELTPIVAGQYIKFKSVEIDEYECIKKEIERGTYKLKITMEKEV